MKPLKQLMLLLLLVGIFPLTSLAKDGDTTIIQVLTFDDISKRRDIIAFPDGSKKYRKIIMNYRLKCDPKTPYDRFNCGEWDYLAYTFLYRPTGQMDSTLKERKEYSIRNASPDSILMTDKIGTTIYHRYDYKRILDEIVEENEIDITSQENLETVVFDKNQSFRFQYIIPKEKIASDDLKAGYIEYVKIFADKAGTIKNFTLRMKTTSTKSYDSFYSEELTATFSEKEYSLVEGENLIVLDKRFRWTRFNNIIIDISGEKAIDKDLPELSAFTAGSGIIAQGSNGYLAYSGLGDKVHCGSYPELQGASQISMECWVKLDAWKNWVSILGIDGKTIITTGGSENQLFAIVRNPDNSHGNIKNAINLNEWTHLAMVYDGTKNTNAERLLLYVNGKKTNLTYTKTIPATSIDEPLNLFIGNNGLNGGMDEVRIFNTAISEETVNEYMYDFDNIADSHPNKENLIAYFKLDSELEGLLPKNSTIINEDAPVAKLIGCPIWKQANATELVSGTIPMNKHLNMILGFSEITSHLDSIAYIESIPAAPISISKYKVNGKAFALDTILYAYPAGWFYTYYADGQKDSTYIEFTNILQNNTISYYETPYEVVDKWEIARFITPYGINLDLGPEGFLWQYDVTDYVDLLKNDVDIAGHNTQELIDLQFIFIEGTPPRDVIKVDRVWGAYKSYKYKNLDSDVSLSEKEIVLDDNTKQIKLKTRLTGHGHNTSSSQQPHCCEWKNNTHYVLANGEKVNSWHIWRPCTDNPVQPQGGTWPFSREGWCPGDVVNEFSFELSNQIIDGKIKLDYEITPVPSDNPGMGDGNYVMAFHLIEYGEANFERDAEIIDITSPSSKQLYEWINNTIGEPIIIVRNNGAEDINSIKFEYGTIGGKIFEYNYEFEKALKPNLIDTIYLPRQDARIWVGDLPNTFKVTIIDVNGEDDMYASNNTDFTTYKMPDIYKEKTPVIILKSSSFGSSLTYKLSDIDGNEIFYHPSLQNESIYRDTLDKLSPGIYTVEITENRGFGLDFWLAKNNYGQKPGYFRVHDTQGNYLKTFNMDFGFIFRYTFAIDDFNYINDEGFENYISVWPLPCTNDIKVRFNEMYGNINIKIYDFNGALLINEQKIIGKDEVISYPTNEYANGIYYIIISDGKTNLKQKFIKQK